MNVCPVCSRRYKQVYRHILALIPGDERHDQWVTDHGISLLGLASYNREAIRALREALDATASN